MPNAMLDDNTEYWIDDTGLNLLLEKKRLRGEQTLLSFSADAEGNLIIVSVNARRTKTSTKIPPGHWWDHSPTDEELEADPASEPPDIKNT